MSLPLPHQPGSSVPCVFFLLHFSSITQCGFVEHLPFVGHLQMGNLGKEEHCSAAWEVLQRGVWKEDAVAKCQLIFVSLPFPGRQLYVLRENAASI